MTKKFEDDFLTIDAETLLQLGCSYPYDMKKGKFWLFITPVFLHGNLEHLISNMVI